MPNVENREITEAEHLIAGVNPNNAARLVTPRPGLVSEVPEGSRQSHADLVRIGLSYYDALDENDGSLTPFADDCQRHENGMITAGPEADPGPSADPDRAPVARGCAAQFDSQTFVYIDRIENRRLIAADPVTGLAMGLTHFRHPMDKLPYEVIYTDRSRSERKRGNMPRRESRSRLLHRLPPPRSRRWIWDSVELATRAANGRARIRAPTPRAAAPPAVSPRRSAVDGSIGAGSGGAGAAADSATLSA